ncbi:Ketopantoate reductase [Halanaeroarchaeum sp. HSR-CO]|uniref:ketopantoate reductase family protein n=1 Tax=Halanaeroarchaeum sp. HSR-CO TaxID=2866382 RepID=UPI00217E8A82|nr:ketopantoate reductase family protein [Halanaeroarchaeum sp. HSR-CO]UWG47664.1 Ketopantoate reductase [Halanaeroarchaeum sp. HSR-CO]
MHVAVLGAGSLGTLFAAKLRAAGVPVTLIGRPGGHLQAIEREGIRIHQTDETVETVAVEVTADHTAVVDADWLLLAVKSYDTASAMSDVADHLDGTTVLTVQNGLGNAETIAEFVPPERVLVGTTAHGASILRAGHVHHAGAGETVIGRYDGDNGPEVDDIASTLTEAGIETVVTDTPRDALWEKVLVNVAINAATALARVPNGHLVGYPAGERLVERAIEEALAVARADGRSVGDEVLETAKTVARETAPNRSSMLQDVEAGSQTEIESLNGAIVDRGEAMGIETPVNRTLADLVRLAETLAED